MASILSALRGLGVRMSFYSATVWRRYRSLPKWAQIIVAIVLLILIIGGFVLARSGGENQTRDTARTVVLSEVALLSGGSSSGSVLGTVRSRAEAEILAEAGGIVRSVNTSMGATVPAGYVIAELENDSQRAAVLQAEGSYDAAVAASQGVSPGDTRDAARNEYREAFSTLDTTLEGDVDTLFGNITPAGPELLVNPIGPDPYKLSRERVEIKRIIDAWRDRLPQADTRDPEILLQEAERDAKRIQAFVDELSETANKTGSRATATQLTAIASARADVAGVMSGITSARATYRSGSTSSTASVDAGVKSALGTLRLAQANLEKTRIRAPIGGTVNFLPIRVGEYVAALTHAATVAQNGALEIVTYVSEDDRVLLAVGTKVTVEENYSGVITSIAPALDPITKQIEVRLAVEGTTELVNGQAVRIALPGTAATPTTEEAGPVSLPLSAVKLRPDDRVIFTVNEEGRLVAHPVETGEVHGDMIEILTALPLEMRIVKDARGLAEGERVTIAP